jgi:hypothetical protein
VRDGLHWANCLTGVAADAYFRIDKMLFDDAVACCEGFCAHVKYAFSDER